MPELRKDYVTDTWVIFAPARSQRPGLGSNERRLTDRDACPFCEGHEHMTPPETYAVRSRGRPNAPGWLVRCVPNKFPALEPTGDVARTADTLYDRVSGVGTHEVIVETPKHDGNLAFLEHDQLVQIILAYRDRYLELSRDPRYRYVLIFKNHGERAGATLSHPHSQLIAMPIVPQRIQEELEAVRRHRRANSGACVFCRVVDTELRERRRVVIENPAFVAISPFAARFPFETWILPKDHVESFDGLDDAGSSSLAEILRDVLARLYHVLNDPDLNYYIHTAPAGSRQEGYHWHIEITPRLAEIAGFERGTGMFINQVMPEDAAAILRGDIRVDGSNQTA